MGSAARMFKKVLIDRDMTQADLAQVLGLSFNTVRNTLYKDNMKFDTMVKWADVLGCDVVLIDRDTGEIYR